MKICMFVIYILALILASETAAESPHETPPRRAPLLHWIMLERIDVSTNGIQAVLKRLPESGSTKPVTTFIIPLGQEMEGITLHDVVLDTQENEARVRVSTDEEELWIPNRLFADRPWKPSGADASSIVDDSKAYKKGTYGERLQKRGKEEP